MLLVSKFGIVVMFGRKFDSGYFHGYDIDPYANFQWTN